MVASWNKAGLGRLLPAVKHLMEKEIPQSNMKLGKVIDTILQPQTSKDTAWVRLLPILSLMA